MPDTKITALTAIGANPIVPATFPIPMVDLTDTSMAASGTTKKVTVNQILGAGGTATLASATITGDLTVDTSTLKVDSANNWVGIGTASPLNVLHVLGSTTGNVGRIVGGGSGQPLFLYSDNSGSGVNNGSNGSYGTGLYFSNASNFLAFYTDTGSGGTEKARIDSSGNVGIGVTPSAWLSSLSALQVKGVNGIYGAGSSEFGSVQNCFYNASSQWIYGTTAAAGKYAISSGVHQWFTAPSGTAGNAITFTQAMTLDASGNLLVGTTAAGAKITALAGASGQAAIFQQPAQNFWCVLAHNQATSGDNSFVLFGTEASFTSRGSITYNRAAGQVSYNITSDYRLKEDVKPLTGALNRISSLKPSTYKFKETGFTCEGFIAHELAEVIPAAVTGEKDAVNEDGSIKAQGVDLSKVVPVLVAAIKELAAEVNALKNA